MRFEDRYSRQVLFPGIGAEGQARLAQAHVAIVGCGATGACVSGLLARAGVGWLTIIDRDYVEPSNLQRQSLFDEADAAESLPKAIAAARKIAAFNSQIVVEPEVADLTPDNIGQLMAGIELVLDGTDNFETRYLLNDYCVTNSVQIHERHRPSDFSEMSKRLTPHGAVRHNDFVLKFWHEPYEMTLFPDGRAIIKGTTDTAVARSLYARYVGN